MSIASYYEDFARDWLRNVYGIRLVAPVVRNNRLRRALGRFVVCGESGFPERIELAGFLLKYGDKTVVLDTLKHELVHYAMYATGRPHDDGHPEFEAELRRLGVSSTNSCYVGKLYIAECDTCGKRIEIDRRAAALPENKHRYHTICCKDRFTVVGYEIYDGISSAYYKIEGVSEWAKNG